MSPNKVPNPNAYKSYQAGRFDGSKSSYRHEMYFLPTQKAQKMQGYSANAADDKTEAVDKMYVLMSVYYRILPSYFEKITCFEIYTRNDLSKSWAESNETPCLTITQDAIHFHTALPEYVKTFFVELIRRLIAGECIANLKPRVKRIASKEKYYQSLLLSSKSFADIEALEKFCREKIATGEAKGLVEDFERKYKSQYFSPIEPESYEAFLQRQKFDTEAELVEFCKKEIAEKGVARVVLGKFWKQYVNAHFPKVQPEPSTQTEQQNAPVRMQETIVAMGESIEKVKNIASKPFLSNVDTEKAFVAHYAKMLCITEADVLAEKVKNPTQYATLLANFIASPPKKESISTNILEGVSEAEIEQRAIQYACADSGFEVSYYLQKKKQCSRQWVTLMQTYKNACQREGRLV